MESFLVFFADRILETLSRSRAVFFGESVVHLRAQKPSSVPQANSGRPRPGKLERCWLGYDLQQIERKKHVEAVA